MFFIWFREAYKNLTKNLTATVLITAFFTVLFLFVGILSNVFIPDTHGILLQNNELYMTKTEFYFTEPGFMDEDGPFEMKMNDFTREQREVARHDADFLVNSLLDMQDEDFIVEYTCHRSFTFRKDDKLKHLYDFKDEYGEYYHVLTVNESFFRYETLPICKGRTITDEDWDFQCMITEDDRELIIPVLAGYEFSKYFELGDRLYLASGRPAIYDPESSWRFLDQEQFGIYEIVGFIEEGTTYSSSGGGIYVADRTVFVPYKFMTERNFPGIGYHYATALAGEISGAFKLVMTAGKEEQYVRKVNELLSRTFLSGIYFLKKHTARRNTPFSTMSPK